LARTDKLRREQLPAFNALIPTCSAGNWLFIVDNQQLAVHMLFIINGHIVDCLLTITRRQRAIIGHQSSMVNEQRAIITLRKATFLINYNLS